MKYPSVVEDFYAGKEAQVPKRIKSVEGSHTDLKRNQRLMFRPSGLELELLRLDGENGIFLVSIDGSSNERTFQSGKSYHFDY